MKTQLKQLMVVVLSVCMWPLSARVIIPDDRMACVVIDIDEERVDHGPLLEYGMPVEEAVRLIGREEVSLPLLSENLNIVFFPTVRHRNLKIFECKTEDSVEYLLLEADEQQKVKNLFKVKKEAIYLLEDDICGAYAEFFNTINIGDDYDEVKRKLRCFPEARFYCEHGVWYVEYVFTFNGKDYPLIFFAATGKVASIKRVDLAFERAYSKRIQRRELTIEVEEEVK
jgi:hypothetical protein